MHMFKRAQRYILFICLLLLQFHIFKYFAYLYIYIYSVLLFLHNCPLLIPLHNTAVLIKICRFCINVVKFYAKPLRNWTFQRFARAA